MSKLENLAAFGKSNASVNCPQTYPQNERLAPVLQGRSAPAAAASDVGARAVGGIRPGVFSYKKGEPVNRLILLNRKRQFVTVLRQFETVDRQKVLALLSVMCQCADCLVTKTEGKNDG